MVQENIEKETMHSIPGKELPQQIRQVVEEIPLAALGPGTPVATARPRLQSCGSLWPSELDRVSRLACQAGLWLAYDFLEESHAISQNLPGVEGGYWHGIMHRREPDASNAKYWFRRVGRHPIFDALARKATELGYSIKGESWDPCAFIDQCEQARDSRKPAEEILRQVQHAEWMLLFNWCWQMG